MADHLFVYGSLRRGSDGRVHPVLAPACTYVTTAYYRGILYDLGPYPGVVPSERADDRVVGELYRMAEPARVLARLDAYEGAQYARERTDVTRDDGERVGTWIYVYTASLADAVRISSGDYRAR